MAVCAFLVNCVKHFEYWLCTSTNFVYAYLGGSVFTGDEVTLLTLCHVVSLG